MSHGKETSDLNLKTTFKRPEELKLALYEPLAIADLIDCKHNWSLLSIASLI